LPKNIDIIDPCKSKINAKESAFPPNIVLIFSIIITIELNIINLLRPYLSDKGYSIRFPIKNPIAIIVTN